MAVNNIKKNAKRKLGGGRKKLKPDYSLIAIFWQQIDAAVDFYGIADYPFL